MFVILPSLTAPVSPGARAVWQDGPFTLTAVVYADADASPHDYDCYDEATVKAWNDNEWQFVGLVVTATLSDVELGEASLWGIDCNSAGSGSIYLFEVAGNLADEAIATARDKLDELNKQWRHLPRRPMRKAAP